MRGKLFQCESREQWLEARKSSVGSSEIAALFGVSEWMTRDSLWAIKSGLVPPPSLDTNVAVYWGKQIEPAILGHANTRHGGIIPWVQNAILKHESHDCIHSTPDAICPPGGFVVEAKFVPFASKAWSDGVPLHYQLQCQHHMEVTGFDRCLVSVLFNGYDYQEFWLERDAELGELIVDKCLEFCRWVVEGVRPPITDEHAAGSGVTSAIFPRRNGKTKALGPQWLVLDQQWSEATQSLEKATKDLERVKDAVRREMGESSYARLPNGTTFQITSNNQLRRKA